MSVENVFVLYIPITLNVLLLPYYAYYDFKLKQFVLKECICT